MEPLVDHLIEERLHRLLVAIAKDIGIADHLRTDDLGSTIQRFTSRNSSLGICSESCFWRA
jgi:hypothetical protein